MSGFKEKTWKKWKENKTTSPVVTVTGKNSIDSITSQRSSSLIRSKKRHETRNAADNILASENQGIIIPRTQVDNGRNNRATTDYKDHRDAEQKNDFKNKSTSPFNTLAPKNPFYRENVVIVQYGELKENDAHSPLDTQESNELWGELPSSEVAESSKPTRKKGPKGGSKHPTTAKKSHHKPKAPPASPTTEKMPPPAPAQAPPKTALGPSASHVPNPHSGQSHHPRTLPSSGPTDGICEVPECPARVPKQKERLCMAPECPVTLKKAVVKEAKKAMKKSSGKKRKNPLTILGAALMSTFAGHDSSCKLTKEEKRALKRMKQAEEDDDDNCNTTVKAKKSRGVQCKAPILQKSERAHRGPEKADKSTVCEIPECPIATQKIKVKEFMDKGQTCDIPSCPVKEPPPRKEKKVEPPKGCPSKPCTLKTKDEEFLRQLDPCIFEKLPRLKMTCDQAFAEENEGQPRPHHTSPAIKNKDKPVSSNKTKDKDKEVKIIVAAHVSVPPASENPFLQAIPNPQDISISKKPTGRESEKNQHNSDRASECQKLLDRPLSTPAFVSEAKSNEFECPDSRSFILSQKKTFVLVTEDEISHNKSLETQFSNVSVNQKGSSSKFQSAKKFERKKSAQMRFEGSLATRNGLKSSLSTLAKNPAAKTHAVCDRALKDESEKEYVASIRTSKSGKSREIEIRPSLHWGKKLEGLLQDFPVTKSCSLEFAVSSTLEDKWPEDTDPPDLLSVLTVNHSSGYDLIPNKILEGPSDLATPTESSAIQLPHRNLNKSKNSEFSFTEPIIANIPRKTKPESKRDQCLSQTILSRDENVSRLCNTQRYVTAAGPSENIQAKIPIISLHFLRRDETTVPIISKQVTVSNARIRKFDDSKAFNEACTQTLASSAISPNELNTIGIGGSSIIDPSSKTLITSHRLISQ